MTAATARPAEGSEARRELLAAVAKPVRDFMQTESGSAGLLLLATVVALAVANSPLSGRYESILATEIAITVGSHELSMDLVHWVNDGLMVLFFFVIGLELRQEISVGTLRQKNKLIVPALGAIGGIAIPALLYLLVNPSGDAAAGWGVVIGTDTAFLLGALALVGPKVSGSLRVFLLTMTIVDDVIAVSIIGLVYSDSLNYGAILLAGACLAAIAILGRLGTWQILAYLVAGVIAWLATIESGLHPSIIGMLAGIMVVSHAPQRDALDRAGELFTAFRQAPLRSTAISAKQGLQRAVPVNERLQAILHPWTSFVIVPIFAFANAGVDLRGGVLADALESPVMWGVVLGLVAGKPLGIGIVAMTAARLRLGPMPRALGAWQVIGGGALSGMGFSVSILIVYLAFDSETIQEQATVGVLIACALSVVTGWVAFRLGRLAAPAPERALLLDPPVDVRRDHILGEWDAPLTLVEYGDFECPFCGTATHVVEDLRNRYGNRLRYVFRHLPLSDIHPHSELSAVAAEAAASQGKFWEMHDRMFEHPDELEIEDLVGHAAAIGLDVEEFARDLAEERHAERVREDVASAEASGVLRTPTFFINGRRHSGPWNADALARTIDSVVAQSAPEAGGTAGH